LEELLLVDRVWRFLQAFEQRLDYVVANIADLERDISKVFEDVYTNNILQVEPAVILVVILPLAREKRRIPAKRPADHLGVFKGAYLVTAFGHYGEYRIQNAEVRIQ
jgi:hypothetical protein